MQTYIPKVTTKIKIPLFQNAYEMREEIKSVVMQIRNFCSLCTHRKGNTCKGYDEPLLLNGRPAYPTKCELLAIFNKYGFNFNMEDRCNN